MSKFIFDAGPSDIFHYDLWEIKNINRYTFQSTRKGYQYYKLTINIIEKNYDNTGDMIFNDNELSIFSIDLSEEQTDHHELLILVKNQNSKEKIGNLITVDSYNIINKYFDQIRYIGGDYSCIFWLLENVTFLQNPYICGVIDTLVHNYCTIPQKDGKYYIDLNIYAKGFDMDFLIQHYPLPLLFDDDTISVFSTKLDGFQSTINKEDLFDLFSTLDYNNKNDAHSALLLKLKNFKDTGINWWRLIYAQHQYG